MEVITLDRSLFIWILWIGIMLVLLLGYGLVRKSITLHHRREADARHDARIWEDAYAQGVQDQILSESTNGQYGPARANPYGPTK